MQSVKPKDLKSKCSLLIYNQLHSQICFFQGNGQIFALQSDSISLTMYLVEFQLNIRIFLMTAPVCLHSMYEARTVVCGLWGSMLVIQYSLQRRGNSEQEFKQEQRQVLWRNDTYWLALHGLLSQLSYVTEEHHSGLDPHISMIN